MKCYIHQPAGLGDILFCQKIGYLLKNHFSSEIIWPVVDQYYYIKEYLNNDINFVKEKDLSITLQSIFQSPSINETSTFHENDEEIMYVPLTKSHVFKGSVSSMEYKYEFMKMDYEDWPKYFEIKKDKTREDILIDTLKIDINSPYNIVNLTFGTYPETCRYDKPVIPHNSYKKVEMIFLGFDRLFDWIPILENAEEIHTVNTSIVYLIEKLNIKGKLYMYARNSKNMAQWYSKNMFRPDWTYIEYD